MTDRTSVHRLHVATTLYQFIEDKVLPGTGVDSAAFWQGFDAIVADLAPKNIALLAERDRLQTEIDAWHKAHPGPITAGDPSKPTDMTQYRAFLERIGYLVENPKKVRINTFNVDAELSKQAGPQLVVPITNARYALNAANARWGSLYDALYGTDALPETDGATRTVDGQPGYNPVRGAKVIEYARHVLDRTAPLAKGSHVDSTGYAVVPAITGSSIKAVRLSEALFGRGISVQPILYPAVQERAARLRFFMNYKHTDADIDNAVSALAEEMERL